MNTIFLGPPGAGKGTVAGNIKDKFNLEHLSTGDMLRAQIKAGTELGNLAKKFIDEGALVPDDVIIGMVKDKLDNTQGGILFDGFPRTVEQAKALGKIAKIDAVVNIDVAVDVIVGRICTRELCRDCGAVYSTKYYDKDSCETCGGELYVRDDDNEQTVRKRFSVYEAQTSPLIEYYENEGVLHTVNGDDTMENVLNNTAKVLEDVK